MKKRLFQFATLALFSLFILGGLAAQDLPVYHAVVSSTRTYMDVGRETKSEYWFTRDKTFISDGRITTIERFDLGVSYTLIVRDNEYYVDTIKPAKTEEKASEKIDFRYVGVNSLASDYDWTVDKKSKNGQVGFFKADQYIADGDADFDHVALEFWLAKPGNQEMTGLFNRIILSSMKNMKTRKPMIDLLIKNKSIVPVKIIELVDNPIASPIEIRILVEKLEAAAAPGDIFELPAGVKQGK
jgi:hypothetical protein